MNTRELQEAAKSDYYGQKFFGGVFASNMLPAKLEKGKIYIYNQDESTEKGSHWCLIGFMNQCIHFDSFGRVPKNVHVIKSMVNSCDNVLYNNIQLQSEFTGACGYHVLMVYFLMSRDYSLNEILDDFYHAEEKQYLRNDALATIIVSSLTKKNPKPLFDWESLL